MVGFNMKSSTGMTWVNELNIENIKVASQNSKNAHSPSPHLSTQS